MRPQVMQSLLAGLVSLTTASGLTVPGCRYRGLFGMNLSNAFQSKLHIWKHQKIQRSVVVSKSESRVTKKTGDLMDLGGFYFQMFHDTFDFGPGFWSLLRSSWCNQVSVGYGPHPRMLVTTRIVTCLIANSYKPDVFAWELWHESAKSQIHLIRSTSFV